VALVGGDSICGSGKERDSLRKALHGGGCRAEEDAEGGPEERSLAWLAGSFRYTG
jgi:hypothetical protein